MVVSMSRRFVMANASTTQPASDGHELFNAGVETGAEFSECRIYRYALWRKWQWQGDANLVMFIGLNPSTADETQDDPTVRRCIRFAKDWGYGGMLMMNAYAFRATDPKKMKAAADPVGPLCDAAFARRRSEAGLFIAAWGAHCSEERQQQVCRAINRPILCLGRTKSGRPRHPLYLPGDSKPEPFWAPTAT